MSEQPVHGCMAYGLARERSVQAKLVCAIERCTLTPLFDLILVFDHPKCLPDPVLEGQAAVSLCAHLKPHIVVRAWCKHY